MTIVNILKGLKSKKHKYIAQAISSIENNNHLKDDILKKLGTKQKNLSENDIELIFNIFTKKITSALYEGKNVELRGFGTFRKKINKAKEVRNPKTNQKIYKKENYKLHFKIGKILHNKLNSELKVNE